jgi:hypothetical protein
VNRKTFIDKTVEQARKKWGLDESWKITWSFSDEMAEGWAEIDVSHWTEKSAHIDVSSKTEDLKRLKKDIYHELGHLVVYPIGRGSSDWIEHYIRSKKALAVYAEQENTRENEVIDMIISNIFRM